jgi:uncharacterized protein with PQ loop repeat
LFSEFAIILGWIGSALLLVASVPQAIKSIREGHSDGLSTAMIWMWGIGMFLSLFYFMQLRASPAIMNYAFNMLVWSVIAWYHHFPRKSHNTLGPDK